MLKYTQVDTFSRNAFAGNPAVVVFMKPPLLNRPEMAHVALEVNQPVTVFVDDSNPEQGIRVWFYHGGFSHSANGDDAVAFSGHGLLAAAHAMWAEGRAPFGVVLTFNTGHESVRISKRVDHICMAVAPWEIQEITALETPLSRIPEKCFAAQRAGMLLLQQESEDSLVNWRPDASMDWTQLSKPMLVLTAPSSRGQRDFVSRVFLVTGRGLKEVGISGSAHRVLLPYWIDKLDRAEVRGEQMSERRGVIHGLRLPDGGLEIAGQAITTLKGILVVHP